jgi:hypothetical protein
MSVRQIDAEQKRLGILGDDEVDAIYSKPNFSSEERDIYFSLSQPEKELLPLLRSVKSQAYFVLQLGYFKAKHRFFTFNFQEVAGDLQYVLKQHFESKAIIDLSPVTKLTRLKQQQLILELACQCFSDGKVRCTI